MARLKLSRAQLAAFLNDPEQIKQFERLFDQTNTNTDTISLDLIAQIGSALAAVNDAQSAVDRLAMALDRAPVAPDQFALETAIQGLQIEPVAQPCEAVRYGSFYDTTPQTAALVNTAYPVTFNSTRQAMGAALGSPSSRVLADVGTYRVTYAAHFRNAGASAQEVWLWLARGGTDIAYSALHGVVGAGGTFQATGDMLVYVGDYVEALWATDSTDVSIEPDAATAFGPAGPSATLSIIGV